MLDLVCLMYSVLQLVEDMRREYTMFMEELSMDASINLSRILNI